MIIQLETEYEEGYYDISIIREDDICRITLRYIEVLDCILDFVKEYGAENVCLVKSKSIKVIQNNILRGLFTCES